MHRLENLDQAIVEFSQEIDIDAPPADVYEGMLRHLTESHTGGPGAPPLPLELERRPGGRWFRNLGDETGHVWGIVQSYRPPTLLEIFGPMFMSYPVSGHLIVRFAEAGEGTRVSFRYSAFGLIQEDHRAGLQTGFATLLAGLKKNLEA